MREPSPKVPPPPRCDDCFKLHWPADVCKETQARERADALEAEELARYDTTGHFGKPARKPPRA